MENKITIDGKEYELSAELVEKIRSEVAAQEKKELPFERALYDEYYYIGSDGTVIKTVDAGNNVMDDGRSLVGNYCRNKELMEQRALHETLNRLLWRYSDTHGGDSNPWPGGTHWFIYGDTFDGLKMNVSANDARKKQGTIYFKNRETANAAIEEVVKPFMEEHPEFVW